MNSNISRKLKIDIFPSFHHALVAMRFFFDGHGTSNMQMGIGGHFDIGHISKIKKTHSIHKKSSCMKKHYFVHSTMYVHTIVTYFYDFGTNNKT